MSTLSESQSAFWQTFLDTLPPDSPYRSVAPTAEAWGDSPTLADKLGTLIANGTKTATCSALWEWEAEGETPPREGCVTIVLNGRGEPLCIVETTEVTVRPFHEVDALFAYEEGEDDRSLEAWREGHWRYFTRTLALIGRTPAEDMPLVCERFRLLFPLPV